MAPPVGRHVEQDALQAALLQRLHLEQRATRSEFESLLEEQHKLKEVQATLASLHEKTRRPVMVPFGKVAFFEGELVRTNEVLVQQGQHLIECSTMQAAEMLGRRLADTGPRLKEVESKLQLVTDRIAEAEGMATSEEEEGIVDIREEWEEQLHGTSNARQQLPPQQPLGSAPAIATAAAAAAAAAAGNGPPPPKDVAVDSEGEKEEVEESLEEPDWDVEVDGSDAAFGDEMGEEGGQEVEGLEGDEEEADFEALMARMEELELQEQQREALEAAAAAASQQQQQQQQQQQPSPQAAESRAAAGTQPAAGSSPGGKGGLKPGFLLGPKSRSPALRQQQLGARQSQERGWPEFGGSRGQAEPGAGPAAVQSGPAPAGHPGSTAFTGTVRERQPVPDGGIPARAAGRRGPAPDPGSPQFAGRPGDPLSGCLASGLPQGSSGVPAAACFPPPMMGLLRERLSRAGQQEEHQQLQQEAEGHLGGDQQEPQQRVSRFKQRRQAGL